MYSIPWRDGRNESVMWLVADRVADFVYWASQRPKWHFLGLACCINVASRILLLRWQAVICNFSRELKQFII